MVDKLIMPICRAHIKHKTLFSAAAHMANNQTLIQNSRLHPITDVSLGKGFCVYSQIRVIPQDSCVYAHCQNGHIANDNLQPETALSLPLCWYLSLSLSVLVARTWMRIPWFGESNPSLPSAYSETLHSCKLQVRIHKFVIICSISGAFWAMKMHAWSSPASCEEL